MVKQYNMFEAKSELSKIVKALELGEEEVVYIARNGNPVVQMTVLDENTTSKRIGVAKGKFNIPDNMEAMDKEIEALFEEGL